jgi:hypothetical protein
MVVVPKIVMNTSNIRKIRGSVVSPNAKEYHGQPTVGKEFCKIALYLIKEGQSKYLYGFKSRTKSRIRYPSHARTNKEDVLYEIKAAY